MRRRRLRGRPKACGPDLAAQPVGRLIDARSPARQPPIGGFAKFIGGSRGAPRNPHASCPGLSRGCPVEQKSFVARENLSGMEPLSVLAELVPAIHAAPFKELSKLAAPHGVDGRGKAGPHPERFGSP